jgi:hypothetical protein
MAHGIAVEIGAVEQGGCGGIDHGGSSSTQMLVVPAQRGAGTKQVEDRHYGCKKGGARRIR